MSYIYDRLLPIESFLEERTPGKSLLGYRTREGLTQIQLSQLTGIPQRHISEMERDKRPMGKQNAQLLADALHTNYKMLM